MRPVRARISKKRFSKSEMSPQGARTLLLHDGRSVHANRQLFKLPLTSELLQRNSIAV